MRSRNIFSSLLKDPPCPYAFELSESGIAAARNGHPPQIGFKPLPPGVISASPLRENVEQSGELATAVKAIIGSREPLKRNEAVLILPDASVRVLVIDFDAFPAEPAEQLSLIRFRIKKGLPFDLDAAAISYHPQTNGAAAGGKGVDVVVAVAPREIVSTYEAAFRSSGLQVGFVTTSTLAALELVRDPGFSVLVKLSGRFQTISVLDHGILRLLRAIELNDATPAEVVAPLHPTFAYVEDQLGGKVGKVLVSGFGSCTEDLCPALEIELGAPVERLRSRLGTPEAYNAGLLGYLESVEED